MGQQYPGAKKILLVDDDETHLELYGDILAHNGYEIVTAKSAQEAFELLKKQSVDLVVLDIRMKGLCGLDALKILDRDHRLVPVILHTGFNYKDDADSGLADAYVTKSMTGTELMQAIGEVLHRYGRL
ncbi:MAG: response regulator [Deferrisomatales bacterium]